MSITLLVCEMSEIVQYFEHSLALPFFGTFLSPVAAAEFSKFAGMKTKIMASGLITSWQIDGETVTDFMFLGSKITADKDCSMPGFPVLHVSDLAQIHVHKEG